MPGERGRRTLERRTREGIPLPAGVVAELSRVAEHCGVTMFPPAPSLRTREIRT